MDKLPFDFDRLLTCDIQELVSVVTPMSADDCEHYARAILDRIGGPTFEQYVARTIETMIPEDGSGPPANSDDYYFAARDLFPHVPAEDDALGRLACFVLRMCVLRMEANR